VKPELELAVTVSAQLGAPITVGDTPQGARRVVPILGGEFEGPKLRGTVLPGGADWQYTRADGVAKLEALYLLRTEDGVHIQVRNFGTRHGPPEVLQRIAAGEDVDPREYYFRSLPEFSAPAGRYEWLNRYVFVASGVRYANSIKLWFYQVV
jgi:hypothetical protein